MTQLGIGVMLKYLAGNEESVKAFSGGVNKEIAELKLEDNELRFTFSDGYKIKLFDDGQSCCESRYMTTDDSLQDFIGSILLDAEISEAPDVESEDNDDAAHEVEFLKVKTSKGVFTMESHNEHNGYYGGFDVCAAVIE